MIGIFKIEFYLFIMFAIFLTILIISGRILNEINLSKCSSDPNIAIAHKWAAWTVGISATGTGITFIAFIAMFFV